MTDPERDHLLGRIADLDRRLRRWRLACLVLMGLLLLPVVLGGLLGERWVPRLERERMDRIQLRVEMERVREAELQARLAADEARLQAERQRAEEEAKRRAQAGPEENKP